VTRVWRNLLFGLGLIIALSAPLAARTTVLFTSLPIIWPEAGDIASTLQAMDKPHWAKQVLLRRGGLEAVDRILPGAPNDWPADLLVMIQPRPLASDENVALDRWLRRGGRLLLFADPMLTADSSFALGDRRRPEAIAMLQPLLRHWGLRLDFDAGQHADEHRSDAFGISIPVELPGQLLPVSKTKACTFAVSGIAAQCRIGKGRVLIVADAALFDGRAGAEADSGAVPEAERIAAFEALLAKIEKVATGENRENSGTKP
jgi:hypothetical protein